MPMALSTNPPLLSLILFLLLLSNASSSTLPPLPSTNTSLISTILSTLGFNHLSTAASSTPQLSLSTAPITIFAPTDSSLLSCPSPSCSLPLLLLEHSIPGLYPLPFLLSLPFATKIPTLIPNRCLTITSSNSTVFINGVQITKPDLFNNGLLIIHSLQGFISHLSPRSCILESMTSLSFPQQPPPTSAFLSRRMMLKDAMQRLRTSGYSIVSLAMRVKYPDLSGLDSMTLFAIDDESIFAEGGEGHAYVEQLGSHIVPGRRLMASDLVSLPKGTVFPTMVNGRILTVTTAGGGGPLVPMRINYVKVERFDMVYNERIVVHGVSTPFRHVNGQSQDDVMGFGQNLGDSRFGFASTAESEFHHGS